MTEETCRPLLDDDGNMIASVHGTHPMSPEGESAMRELVAAVQRHAKSDPEIVAMLDRQEAARGTCQDCGYRHRLLKTGLLARHLIWHGAHSRACLGSYELPKEARA